VIGGENGVAVVLDDDHRVAEVAQALEDTDQTRVVARMQPDRRLVEHVEHADQARADLGREPEALPFPARQRECRAVERQVAEPDFGEKAQPGDDLCEQPSRHLALVPRQGDLAEECERVPHRESRRLDDRAPADGDVPRLRPQARPLARRAGPGGEIRREVLLLARVERLAAALLEETHDPLEGSRNREALAAALVRELDFARSRAPQDRLARFGGEVAERRVEIEAEGAAERGEHGEMVGRGLASPRRDRALAERQPLVGDDQIGVEAGVDPETTALGTRAVRTVEGKEPRRQLGKRHAALRAGEPLAEQDLLFAGAVSADHDAASLASVPERHLERVG
jgi:hypothetical protein